jgi:hypothetical protein
LRIERDRQFRDSKRDGKTLHRRAWALRPHSGARPALPHPKWLKSNGMVVPWPELANSFNAAKVQFDVSA